MSTVFPRVFKKFLLFYFLFIATDSALCYNLSMNLNLARYANKKICVAVSGGKDSMALLHYLSARSKEYSLTITAVNCDHGIRGEASARDSEFVKEWCSSHDIPLCFFKANGFKSEGEAREWRYLCYFKAVERFGGAIATAHHVNDNAETVLFNLARGSALGGVCGISDGELHLARQALLEIDSSAYTACGVGKIEIIRPLIAQTREDIDDYVAENAVPFVTDETNASDDYTRNYIRHNVLPDLENAVPGAAKAIYRFSRLAAEDEEFIQNQLSERKIFEERSDCCIINYCQERPLFNRAAVRAVKAVYGKKDYTLSHLDTLYGLQLAENGKIFRFLGLTAYKEQGRVVICGDENKDESVMPFEYGKSVVSGYGVEISKETDGEVLRASCMGNLVFDCRKIPENAAIRTRRAGDKITKFGGGTKSLGDYFTDRKIPLRLRDRLPLIAADNDILAVCGVEISDKIKIDENTKTTGVIRCTVTL